jgi:CheY-like chemotaxis protein
VEADVPNDVRGDGVRLRQVLLNLLSNAMKFTSQGIVTLTVSRECFAKSASADAARDLVRFTVTDTGIGISPSALGRLFESFSQADSSTTRRYGGSGLGLAIARQIAEVMGGTVGVTSEVGRGSTFWFTARLVKSAAAPLPRAAIDRDDVLAGVRVLIADDQPVSLAGLAEQMRQLGASTVDTVSTIGDAHHRLAEAARDDRAYHIAFVDESLALAPQVATDAATDAADDVTDRFDARTFPSGTIALMTTTRSRSSPGERATTIGYRGSVTKPARRRHLEAIVLSALGREAEARAGADAERLKHASSQAIAAAHGHGRTARARRILVAEDNEINQKVIGRMLHKLGHQVDIVVNGLEAVEACARHAYDLVLMDCQMPELDGYDATARIRQQDGLGARIPIVALTADASVADRDRCLAAGMDDFLGKPVRPHELTRAIERWTAHAHGLDDARQTA